MTRNYRAIRFGYWIYDGQVMLQPMESKIVKWIYEMYLYGYSYQELANHLAADEVFYQGDDGRWNKHIIKRILEAESYYGDDKYPQIIEKEQWEQVQKIRQMRSEARAVKTIWPKLFRQKLFCAECGSRIYRGNQGKRENWQCRMEGKLTKDYITDEVFWKMIVEKQSKLIVNPGQLRAERRVLPEKSIQIDDRRNEIIKQIKLQQKNEDEILKMIYQAAAEQYETIREMDVTYETERLIRLYQEKQIGSEPDFELIEHTVRKIWIDAEGEIYFEMTNGIKV